MHYDFLIALCTYLPLLAKSLLVTVTVLGDYCVDALWMPHCDVHSYWCAIVEDVYCKMLQANEFCELADSLGCLTVEHVHVTYLWEFIGYHLSLAHHQENYEMSLSCEYNSYSALILFTDNEISIKEK